MAGDLEDFLRRAAARRQQKAAQEQQQTQQRQHREPPQYSDSRTERVPREVESVDEVLVADVVEDTTDSYSAQLQRIEDTKRAAAKAERESKRSAREATASAPKRNRHASNVDVSGNTARDLINMLKRPGGVQQAILVREVFDRPEHRW